MAQQIKLTLSVVKADIGSVAGHNRPHPDLLKQAEAAGGGGDPGALCFPAPRPGVDAGLPPQPVRAAPAPAGGDGVHDDAADHGPAAGSLQEHGASEGVNPREGFTTLLDAC